MVRSAPYGAAALVTVAHAVKWALEFRVHAIRSFGTVIHEFDPWFNYRATEYMAANGWDKFQVRGSPGRRGRRLLAR